MPTAAKQAELDRSSQEHAAKIALPSALGIAIAPGMWTEDYLVDPWVLEVEAAIIDAVMDEDPNERHFIRVHLPPQVGKTRYMTLLAFWLLGVMPETRIIFVTYSDDYSANRGREIRNMIDAYGWMFGIEIDPNTKSASDFKLKGHRGGVLAVGIGSQITGRSGDVIIIDDLLKNAQEAASKAAKDLHEEEFDRTLYPRLQPGGTMILTNTRWSEDDLAGRLETREADPEYVGDRFEVLTFPAIAEMPAHDEVELTPDEREAWSDIIGRVEGEPLKCRYFRGGDWDKSIFYKIRATMIRSNPIGWASTYQQNPTSREGSMFPAHKWNYYHPEELPELYAIWRVWDLAASEGSGDWTVGTKMGRGSDGKMYVIDCIRDRLSPDNVLALVKRTALADGFTVGVGVEETRAGDGKTVTAFYKKALTGFRVEGCPAVGQKETRAVPYSTLQQQGDILLPYDVDVDWDVKGFVDEHKQMMGDGRKPRYDDRIDTGAYCVNLLVTAGPMEVLETGGASADVEDQMFALLMRTA
jgi:predicted phage terminase large subunit-like protein